MKSLLTPALLCFAAACSHAAPVAERSSACPFAAQAPSDLSDWRAAGFETDSPDRAASDLAAAEPGVVAAMREQLDAWRDAVANDTVYVPPAPKVMSPRASMVKAPPPPAPPQPLSSLPAMSDTGG